MTLQVWTLQKPCSRKLSTTINNFLAHFILAFTSSGLIKRVSLFLQTYEKVANAFKSEESVVIANLDADKHGDLAEK